LFEWSGVDKVLSSGNEWNPESVLVESFSDTVAVVHECPAVDHQLAVVGGQATSALKSKSGLHSWNRCYDFLSIFSPKKIAKKLAFSTQNIAKLFKNVIIILVFVKHANFFAKNCQNMLKIVTITSVPGWRRNKTVNFRSCLSHGSNPTTFEFAAIKPAL
jgi:hypothetical protein